MSSLSASEARVVDYFHRVFGRGPAVVVSAPGRVNLIGEHTDYNGGFVLPMAIPQRTWVAASTSAGSTARVTSANLGSDGRATSFEIGGEVRRHTWVDYVQGCTQAMTGAGVTPGGFDMAIWSDVPLGSGLSSSAALEVAVMRALRTLFTLTLDDVLLAQLGQRAENHFVGAPVGLMDQMAASLADDHTALFLDTRTLQFEQVALPAGGELVVINSGVAHNHASGDYRTRRAECERAASMLGAPQLRDLAVTDLDRIASLPDPINRRARHVVTENQRVLDSVDAMKQGDLERLGRLFYESHASQRDDFAVSVPEVDLLVRLTEHDPLVFGARLTGGGFGGSVVLLVRAGSAQTVSDRVIADYAAGGGPTATRLVPKPD